MIVQRIKGRVTLGTVDAAMPIVASRLRYNIDNRTGIAPVLRTKLVGDDDILLHELRIRKKQSGSANAVVIVVLAIDLLVVVASTQTIDRKPRAIGIRERIVSCV